MRKYFTVMLAGLTALIWAGFYFAEIDPTKSIEAPKIGNILNQLVSVGGALLGFLMAAMAILTGLLDRPLLENLRRSGHLNQLVSELAWSSWFFFFTVLFAVVSIFFEKVEILQWLFPLAVGSFAFGMALLAAALYHFFLVLTHVR